MENGLLWIFGTELLEWISGLFNSSFGAAFAGALLGAFGAGVITKKLKEFDDKMLELRQTRAAIGVSGTICNSYISAKADYVIPLYTQYYSQMEAYEEFHAPANAVNRSADNTFYPKIVFQKFTQEPVGSDRLQQLVFDNLGSNIKMLHLCIALVNVMKTVQELCVERNGFIDKWASGVFGDDDGTKLKRYLGKRFGDQTDETYKNYVDYLMSNTDNCIHFSDVLQSMLHNRAVELRGQLVKRTWLSLMRKTKVPKIERWDFTAARSKGLFPDPMEFKDIDAALGRSTFKT